MYLRMIAPCDRCGERIEGYLNKVMLAEGVIIDVTSGYYDVTPTEIEAGWDKLANPGERIICNRCMFTDPRYLEVYGPAHALTLIEQDTRSAEAARHLEEQEQIIKFLVWAGRDDGCCVGCIRAAIKSWQQGDESAVERG